MLSLLLITKRVVLLTLEGSVQRSYDTLQACASISLSNLCTFHLPYLVTFVNKLFFCFVSKYLGLPVLTKYFVKIVCLSPEVGQKFCYFTLTFGHSYTYNTCKFTFKPFRKV